VNISKQPPKTASIQEIVDNAILKGEASRCACGECQNIFTNWHTPHISVELAGKVKEAINTIVINPKSLTGMVSLIHNGSVIVGINYQYADLAEVAYSNEIGTALCYVIEDFYDCETESGEEYLPLNKAA